MIARNALNDRLPVSGLSVTGSKNDYESESKDKEDNNDPSDDIPEPMWNGPSVEARPNGHQFGSNNRNIHRTMIN